MPIHDWERLNDGDFHHFHQRWIQAIADNLNAGALPAEYMALSEQIAGRPIPDVVALQTANPDEGSGGIAVASAPPTARTIAKFERGIYSKRTDRVVIRHGRGKVVAIIEIASPGNKSSANALRTFVQKAADILNQGIHLLVVDLFPPTTSDPNGLQKAICDELDDVKFELPIDKPLTVGAFVGGELPIAYIECAAVGDPLPSLPLFLSETRYIPAPLESTYVEAWSKYPRQLREIMERQA